MSNLNVFLIYSYFLETTLSKKREISVMQFSGINIAIQATAGKRDKYAGLEAAPSFKRPHFRLKIK